MAPRLLARLERGDDVAQVTDAGMPGISDPGTALVNAAREAGIPIEVVPGPDAVTTALVASGFPSVPFTFHGFAPRKPGDRKRVLGALSAGTHIFYESPERLPAFAKAVAAHRPDADVAICRELTKQHEEVLRGGAREIAVDVAEGVRGEVVVLLYLPEHAAAAVSDATLREAVTELTEEGVDRKSAVKEVAARYAVPKRRVYSLTIEPD